MRFKSIRKKDQQQELSRRALLGWMGAAGACLSIPAWKVWEVIEGTHGKAWAQDASCITNKRYISVDSGVGGQAVWTNMWTSQTLGQQASGNEAYTWIGQADRGELVQSDNPNANPLWYSPAGRLALEPITDKGRYGIATFIVNGNQTHTQTATVTNLTTRGIGLQAAAGTFGIQNPGLLAGFAVSDPFVGAAPGAPQYVTVNNAAGVIDQVNSAATQAGALLSNEQNASRWKANYDALMSLNKIAGLETTKNPFGIAKTGAFVIGKNLANLLRPTVDQETRYGYTGQIGRVREFGELLAISANLFANNITSTIAFQGFNHDPHGAFNDEIGFRQELMGYGQALKGFFEDMSQPDEVCSGSLMYQNLVMKWHGDTCKNWFNRGGWPDGTPTGAQSVYMFGGGDVRPGLYGDLTGGTAIGWDVSTGAPSGAAPTQMETQHVAGITLHAIANRNNRAVEPLADYELSATSPAIPTDGT
jgi:hypothetical protein